MSKLYVLGVGPGDSKLMTVKATELIKSADIIVVPQNTVDKPSVAEIIAKPYIEDEGKVKRYVFPMVNDLAIKQKHWREAAEDMIKLLKAGNTVVYLTLGDPTVYCTYMYLDDMIEEAGFRAEIVPAVSAFTAFSAVSGNRIVEDKERFCVVSGIEDFEQLPHIIDLFDTIIIMKAGIKFKEIHQILTDKNLIDKTLVVSNATMENEEIISDLNTVGDRKLPYFSTMLIKKRGIK